MAEMAILVNTMDLCGTRIDNGDLLTMLQFHDDGASALHSRVVVIQNVLNHCIMDVVQGKEECPSALVTILCSTESEIVVVL